MMIMFCIWVYKFSNFWQRSLRVIFSCAQKIIAIFHGVLCLSSLKYLLGIQQ